MLLSKWVRMIFLALLTLPLTPLSLLNAQSSGVTSLQPNYYLYYNVTVYNGQFIHVKLYASSPVTFMIMNQQQFNEFRQGQRTSSLYTIVTQSVNQNFKPLSEGEYFVLAYNNITNSVISTCLRATVLPILPLTYHSSLPAPIGLGFYGVANESGTIVGTIIPYQEAIGYATVYSILAYNSTPPKGTSPWGAGLQMNAVLQVNTTYGTYDYWLQNVVDFLTNNNSFYIEDNVWNYTAERSFLSNSTVTGDGHVYFYKNENDYYYASFGTSGNYSYPFSVILYTRLDFISASSVSVSFGYNLGPGIMWYDNVTIHQLGTVSASLLINPFNMTPSRDPYDLDLVFAGESNGEHTFFEKMNASLGLQMVLLNGTVITPSSFYSFGVTEEASDNLMVVNVNGTAFVVLGNDVFWKQITVNELPRLYLVYNSSSTSQLQSGVVYLIIGFVFIFLVFFGIYSLIRKIMRRRRRRSVRYVPRERYRKWRPKHN
ncbi:hypothetical protein HS7_14490 [Sulfolobales archaeon HS-7]|nr:hypothetical protein HS7_14490 [Sulfolobales archaeon HS-7]